ncbi:hypothetical protein DES53_108305 [Roseimicrobium gellanilyticum]|uniref:Lipoprotein n=1 Tax=Roseimicrobium gellanilyticum TaxID=748857 RepID=A0A366HGK7_9BACT|nr:hypothetical protein [Roseimicrobium gellanilyticum]RBP40598.1 hypothetical protein DES53_108305 [Roseimicrobium gellanilyticum]
MRNRTFTLLASCITFLIASCVTTETRRDERFTPIFGKPIETAKPLYLYALNKTRNGDPSRHGISVSKMIMDDEKSEILAILPVGHRVTFEKLRRTPQSGGVAERLVGFTVYKNVRYPVTYLLGFSGAKIGWEDSIKAFKIPGQTQNPM